MALDNAPNFNPNTPIPNSPFYWPDTYRIQGGNGDLIVGLGLNVNISGELVATGGGIGSGTVTQVNTGLGLSGGPITTTGTIFLLPATSTVIGGVRPDGVTTQVSVSGVISASTVLQVNTGLGLVGGPITSTGTISLAPATTVNIGGVKPDNSTIKITPSGTIYVDLPTVGGVQSVLATAPITVDSSSPANPIIGIANATLDTPGAVRLTDSYAGTSNSFATTQYAVNALSQAALLKIGGTMVGDIVFAPTQAFPVATTTTLGVVIPDNTTIFISPSGVISSPGAAGTITEINTGVGLTGGPITTSGTISLVPATDSTIGGVKPDNTTIAVSPDGTISVVGGVTPGGINGSVQYNDGGALGGTPAFVWNAGSNSLTVQPGYIVTQALFTSLVQASTNSNLTLSSDGTGNVLINPGTGSGSVQIGGISQAAAVAAYVPVNPTDLATKAYVDASSGGSLILESGATSYGAITTLNVSGTNINVDVSATGGVGTLVFSVDDPTATTGGYAIVTTGPSGIYSVNANTVQLFALPALDLQSDNLSYSGGVFTNISSETRTFTIDIFSTWLGASITNEDAMVAIWVQKNNALTPDPQGAYALDGTSGTFYAQGVISSTWAFELNPGDTMSLWCSVPTTSSGDPQVFGVFAPSDDQWFPAAKVLVHEIPGINGAALPVATIDARKNSFTLGGGSPATKIIWDSFDEDSIDTLTWSSATGSFTNSTQQTRTYIICANTNFAPPAGTNLTEVDLILTKNNTGATIGNQNRVGQTADSFENNFIGRAFIASGNTSWTVRLSPGESFQSWVYASTISGGSCTVGGALDIGPFTVANNYGTRLKIVEITPSATASGTGTVECRQSQVTFPAATASAIPFDITDTFDSVSLSKQVIGGVTYFVNDTDAARSYRVTAQVAAQTASKSVIGWIAKGGGTQPNPNQVYGGHGSPDLAGTNNDLYTMSSTLTLGPNERLSFWVYSEDAVTVGLALFGNAVDYSTKLKIAEVTAVTAVAGTITGVIAGVGLTGGGFTGNVTVDLLPATTERIGGVIPDGTSITLDVDGTIAAGIIDAGTY